jgi:hypothetical protein
VRGKGQGRARDFFSESKREVLLSDQCSDIQNAFVIVIMIIIIIGIYLYTLFFRMKVKGKNGILMLYCIYAKSFKPFNLINYQIENVRE